MRWDGERFGGGGGGGGGERERETRRGPGREKSFCERLPGLRGDLPQRHLHVERALLLRLSPRRRCPLCPRHRARAPQEGGHQGRVRAGRQARRVPPLRRCRQQVRQGAGIQAAGGRQPRGRALLPLEGRRGGGEVARTATNTTRRVGPHPHRARQQAAKFYAGCQLGGGRGGGVGGGGVGGRGRRRRGPHPGGCGGGGGGMARQIRWPPVQPPRSHGGRSRRGRAEAVPAHERLTARRRPGSLRRPSSSAPGVWGGDATKKKN